MQHALRTKAGNGYAGLLQALAKVLKARDVLIQPGTLFSADPIQDERFFRLAYSSISAERIPEGIRRIAQAMSEVQD